MPYVNGFSATYPITSDPELAIDPATGLITGTPTAPGQYAIGICVSEYRNGVLLNTTTRDFQFNITLCDPNIESVVAEQTPAQLCIGETITMDNNSVNGTDYAWDFGVPGTTTDVSTEFEPTFTWPALATTPSRWWSIPDGLAQTPPNRCIRFGEPVEPNIVLEGFSAKTEQSFWVCHRRGAVPGNEPVVEFRFRDTQPFQFVQPHRCLIRKRRRMVHFGGHRQQRLHVIWGVQLDGAT